MSAIIWKEFRENLRWAVLWMLAIGAAMAFVLYQSSRPYMWSEGGSLLSGGFMMITIIGSALGASLLGLVQTVPERRRGRRGRATWRNRSTGGWSCRGLPTRWRGQRSTLPRC